MSNIEVDLYQSFLHRCGFKNYKFVEQLSDASPRKYFRINTNIRNVILMDSSREPHSYGDFIKLTKILTDYNINAPKIFNHDDQRHLILIEDFGDESITKYLEKNSKNEESIYKLIIDRLLEIQKIPVSQMDIPQYSTELLLKEIKLFIDWYLIGLHQLDIDETSYQEFANIWKDLLDYTKYEYPVLVLRDYHADNIHWIESKKDVGFIDYQDAVIGSPAYDLVSLLEDARRDVDIELREKLLNNFIEKGNFNKEEFLNSYYILGAQRNCKIIGIFARLMLRDDKKQYVNYIPRVIKYLINDLTHPKLKIFSEWLENVTNIKEFLNE